MKTYETERFILKPSDIEDAAFFLELYNSPQFIENIGDRNLRTIEDAEKYITEKFRPQLEKLGLGNYVVIRKEDSQKIGAVGIFERDGLDVMDIGFSYLPEFIGKGNAFEAANKLKEVALEEFGIQNISAITTTSNIPSQKLIEKLGLKFKKMVTLPNDGRRTDVLRTNRVIN